MEGVTAESGGCLKGDETEMAIMWLTPFLSDVNLIHF